MANALYYKYKENLLNPASTPINLMTDVIKVALCTAGYTANINTDQYFSAVSSNYVGTPTQITSPSVTNGVFNGATVSFSGVTGATITQLVIYKEGGTAGSSPLICRDDTASGSVPIGVTPNGGSITVTWDAGASKIFAL